MPKKTWFPARRYGIGWGLPSSWQGWAILIAYTTFVSIMTAEIYYNPGPKSGEPFIIAMTMATVFLLWVCWMKGERLQWRWGNTKKKASSKK
jgi:hypothetical protein